MCSGLETDNCLKEQVQKSLRRRWTESASLILLSRNAQAGNPGTGDQQVPLKCDYKVLIGKRSGQAIFVQNHCVFAGGYLNAADKSAAWLNYFEEFGVSDSSLKKLVVVSATKDEPRPAILKPKGNGCYDSFFKQPQIWAKEISLRLTALRKTFEQVGVLLCRSREQLDLTNAGGCVYFKDDFDNKRRWQEAVQKDVKEFLHLCRTLCVVPDLWALYEWSAWASPALVRKPIEVVLFIAFAPRQLDASPDTLDIVECLWESPGAIILHYRLNKLYLLPPQVYELSRFLGMPMFDALLAFARERSSKGVTLNLPVLYGCNDGVVWAMPGDDLYPINPRSAMKIISMECSKAELLLRAKHVHRCEEPGTPIYFIHINIDLPHGQLPPMNGFLVEQPSKM